MISRWNQSKLQIRTHKWRNEKNTNYIISSMWYRYSKSFYDVDVFVDAGNIKVLERISWVTFKRYVIWHCISHYHLRLRMCNLCVKMEAVPTPPTIDRPMSVTTILYKTGTCTYNRLLKAMTSAMIASTDSDESDLRGSCVYLWIFRKPLIGSGTQAF